MMDANEHVLDGKLCRQLTMPGIDLVEAVHRYTGLPSPPTFFRGSKPIDGIWVSPELEVEAVSILPFHKDIGDHRPIIIDITNASLIGEQITKIVPAKARKLNSKVSKSRQKL